jgi:hypothetical protein
MNKRKIGEIYSTIGSPFVLSVFSAYSGLSSTSPVQFFLSAGAALLTLPLAPFAMIGDSMVRECDEEDFAKTTEHLPKVFLPKKKVYNMELPEAASIDGPDENGSWWVDPFYYSTDDEGEYKSEQEARDYLVNKGYVEVVALDYPNHLGTHWIKKEEHNG